jgi:hypothetical protein
MILVWINRLFLRAGTSQVLQGRGLDVDPLLFMAFIFSKSVIHLMIAEIHLNFQNS